MFDGLRLTVRALLHTPLFTAAAVVWPTILARERLLSSLTGIFAGLATLLAAIGLYGVLAYNVARRTREIGIRMALGAGRQQVRRLVVRDVALVVGIGIAAGIGGAALMARFLESVCSA